MFTDSNKHRGTEEFEILREMRWVEKIFRWWAWTTLDISREEFQTEEWARIQVFMDPLQIFLERVKQNGTYNKWNEQPSETFPSKLTRCTSFQRKPTANSRNQEKECHTKRAQKHNKHESHQGTSFFIFDQPILKIKGSYSMIKKDPQGCDNTQPVEIMQSSRTIFWWILYSCQGLAIHRFHPLYTQKNLWRSAANF